MGIENALAFSEVSGDRVLVFLGPLEQGIDALGLVHGLTLLFHQALQCRLAVREICGLGNVLAEELHDFLGQDVAKARSEEHTSELQSLAYLVCRLLLEKKKKKNADIYNRSD